MGILLAYALLTVVIHSHNASVKKHGTRPITACPLRKTSMDKKLEPIGIVCKQHLQKQNTDHWEIDISSNVNDMELALPIFQESIQKFNISRINSKVSSKKALEKMKMFTLSNSVVKFSYLRQDHQFIMKIKK